MPLALMDADIILTTPGKALDQAKAGRLHLLEQMGTVPGTPRAEFAGNAPQMHSFQLPKEKIRDIIGDEKNGKIKLSRKALLAEEAGATK